MHSRDVPVDLLYLINTCYPQRPICLYDFVAEYTKDGIDEDGNTKYCQLNKPVLPNHKIYNPKRGRARVFLLFSPPVHPVSL